MPASGHCHGRPLLAGTLVAEARVRPVSNRHISRATGILARAAGFLFRPCRGLPRCLWNRQIRHRHSPRPRPLPWAHHTIGCIMPAMACIATMKHDLHAAPQRRGGRHSPKMAYQYGDLTPSGHSLTGRQPDRSVLAQRELALEEVLVVLADEVLALHHQLRLQ